MCNKTRRLIPQVEFLLSGWGIIIIGLMIFCLYFASRYNYLLFHSLIELFSIIISWSVFIIILNAYKWMNNRYLFVLGAALAAAGCLDLVHLLSYKGMNLFPEYDSNLPTQLWIAARYLLSLSMFFAILFYKATPSQAVPPTDNQQTKLRFSFESTVVALYSVIVILLMISIFQHQFPVCYIEGQGMTPFKKTSEIMVNLILLASLAVLWGKRAYFNRRLLTLIIAATIISIFSGLAFTIYVDVYDFYNMIGHFGKLVVFYLIYLAVIEAGLQRPYGSLFKSLSQQTTALQKSEEQHRLLIQNLHSGVVVHGSDTEILLVNQEASRLLGLSKEQMQGKVVTDPDWYFFKEDGNQLLPEEYPVSVTIATGQSLKNLLFGINRPDTGDIVWVLVNTYPEFDDNQQLIQIVVSFIDITKRKLSDESIKRNAAKQNTMLTNIADVIAIMDQNGIIQYKSPNIETIFGWLPEDLVGLSGFETVHPDDLERIQQEFTSLLDAGNNTTSIEFRYRCKDGSYLPVQLAAVNLIHSPDIQGVLLNYHDITNQKQAEEKEQAVQIELQQLLKETERSRQVLLSLLEDQKQAETEKEMIQSQLLQAQKMESVGRLAGGMAHDFNNKLGVIMGYTESALAKIPPHQVGHQELQAILNASERSADLIQQLLAFARQQVVSPRILNLNETISDMLIMLKRMIGENIELVWRPAADLKTVMIDPSQVDQVMANLLVNARDAIPGVGKIVVETDQVIINEVENNKYQGMAAGEYTLLTVSDTGSGMDEETLAHIFEPFYTTKEVGKGTGLGLSTTFGIIKQNNGNIYASSQLGEGTTFKIFLPSSGAEVIPTSIKEKESTAQKGNETILMVEDEEELLELGMDALEDFGYTVLGATTPAKALQLVREYSGSLDLVISDVVMPEMNGKDLVNQIHLINPDLKCLFMSGYTADIIADFGKLDEEIFFIQKPFLLKDLAEKVRRILEN
ncbi:MAG: PAS domain S-box protein [Anaerolineaceae bacterium]|nr:PAS domain S-box protein [Anaerolineaceae bacterium]